MLWLGKRLLFQTSEDLDSVNDYELEAQQIRQPLGRVVRLQLQLQYYPNENIKLIDLHPVARQRPHTRAFDSIPFVIPAFCLSL